MSMIWRGAVPEAWATRSEVASMSSTVAEPISTSPGTEEVASSSVGNTSRPVATSGAISTVRSTASATKPSVPSEPIISRCRIRTGSVSSRNALRP